MKTAKIILIGVLLIASAICFTPASSQTTHSTKCGDINSDDLCNSTDALIILSYDVGLSIPADCLDKINAGCGDVNKDGSTNSTDALIILSWDVGLPVPYCIGDCGCPCPEASPIILYSLEPTCGPPGTMIMVTSNLKEIDSLNFRIVVDGVSYPIISKADSTFTFVVPLIEPGDVELIAYGRNNYYSDTLVFTVQSPLPTGLPPGEISTGISEVSLKLTDMLENMMNLFVDSSYVGPQDTIRFMETLDRIREILSRVQILVSGLTVDQKTALDEYLYASGLSDAFGITGGAGLRKELVHSRPLLAQEGEFSTFYECVSLDNISFILSGAKAVARGIAIVCAITGIGTPAAAVTIANSFVIDVIDQIIDGFFPTDLCSMSVSFVPNEGPTLQIGETARGQFLGFFQSQSSPTSARIGIFLSGLTDYVGGENYDKLITDILSDIGLEESENILDLEPITQLGPMPIDLSYYTITFYDIFDLFTAQTFHAGAWCRILEKVHFGECPELGILPITVNSSLVDYDISRNVLLALHNGVVESDDVKIRVWLMDSACERKNQYCFGLELPEFFESSSISVDPITIYLSGCGTMTDVDGNVYQTIQIGNQCWMAENLKVTHYRNGDPIPNVTGATDWSNLITGAYSNYNNDANNVATYGRLYNWYAVDDSRNIAPAGWHVPTDEEWKELEMYLGMSQSEVDDIGLRGTNEGSKLAGNASLWLSGALENNSQFGTSGFTALPAGFRNYDGSFYGLGYFAFFWSATESSSSSAWGRYLYYVDAQVFRYDDGEGDGFSLRCVRNADNVPPTSSFTVNPASGTIETVFNVDASSSSDDEDATSSLQVRWDWENDGTYDTGWSTTKTASHQYSSEATHTIKLEVKDTGGLTDTDTKQVTVDFVRCGTVTDYDGNVYQTVQIGSQCWMAENLKVTHYRNGAAIPNITDEWGWTWPGGRGAYCDYANDSSYVDTYQ